jgi:alkylhydroperoxidase/carboxymuconolactone decarboxylase family protein YurZ
MARSSLQPNKVRKRTFGSSGMARSSLQSFKVRERTFGSSGMARSLLQPIKVRERTFSCPGMARSSLQPIKVRERTLVSIGAAMANTSPEHHAMAAGCLQHHRGGAGEVSPNVSKTLIRNLLSVAAPKAGPANSSLGSFTLIFSHFRPVGTFRGTVSRAVRACWQDSPKRAADRTSHSATIRCSSFNGKVCNAIFQPKTLLLYLKTPKFKFNTLLLQTGLLCGCSSVLSPKIAHNFTAKAGLFARP